MKGLEQPHSTHPGDHLAHHDADRFGCTICHDGQGRATTWKDALAHDWSSYYELPMLRQPYIQARCYRCHTEELAETPVYNQGKKLFESSGCLGCHRLGGKGGSEGPALDGLSDAAPAMKHASAGLMQTLLSRADQNRNIAFLLEAIQYPSAQPADSKMFNYSFDDAQSEALAVYLKSFENDALDLRAYVPSPDGVDVPTRSERGARLFGLYCSGCHGSGGKGGIVNANASSPTIPALNNLNERLMLFEREDAETLVQELVKSRGAPPSPDDLDVARASVVVATYDSVWKVIENGNPSGREDPNGPVPLSMPSWKSGLAGDEVVSIVSYLLSVGEYEDDED
jgi:mono/diheme cytochrome c family protein